MVHFSFFLLSLLAGPSLAVPTSPADAKVHNANHIFRAIHSAGRQWHESLHHNGLSFFLATIPAGTHLYHGRGNAALVTGMDWLALEPEHAANFALHIHNGSSDCESSASSVSQQQHLSPKWTWPWDFLAIKQPDIVRTRKGPNQALDPKISTQFLQPIPAATHDQFPLIYPTDSQPPPPPDLTLCPGYLHIYTTERNLRLLYIDGMSAAKSPLGTLDTQDNILLRQSALRPGRHPADDAKRARGLCELTRTHYGDRIDGFVRMEHGFEVVLCDFQSGALHRESVLAANGDGDGARGVWAGSGDAFWQFFNAVADRYPGVGGGRLHINVEGMVSVFAYPDVDVWADSEDGILPNISRIEEVAAARIAADVTDLVVHGRFPGDDSQQPQQQHIDWRGVAELHVTRYARRLIYLTSKQTFTSAEARANATRAIYAVYSDDNEAKNHHRPSEAAIERCTNAFVPPSSSSSSSNSSIPRSAITAVAQEICTALSDVMTTLSHDFAGQQQRLETLMRWLQWPEFKACAHDDGRGCSPDELCFVAMWPWGGQADHDAPRCWKQAALEEHLQEVAAREDYWRMGELR